MQYTPLSSTAAICTAPLKSHFHQYTCSQVHLSNVISTSPYIIVQGRSESFERFTNFVITKFVKVVEAFWSTLNNKVWWYQQGICQQTCWLVADLDKLSKKKALSSMVMTFFISPFCASFG